MRAILALTCSFLLYVPLTSVVLSSVALAADTDAQTEKAQDQSKESKEKTQVEISQAKARIDAAQKALKQAQQNYAKHDKAVSTNSKSLSTTLANQRQLKQEIKDLNSAQQKTKESIVATQNTIQQQIEWLAGELVHAYKQGNDSQIKLVMNGASPTDILRLLRYTNTLQTQRNQQLDQLKGHQTRLQSLQAQQLTQNQNLQSKEKDLQQQSQKFAQLKKEHQSLKAQSQSTANSKRTQITQLNTQVSELEKILDEIIREEQLQAALKDEDNFKGMKGFLPLPMSGKVHKTFEAKKHNAQGEAINAQWHGIWLTTQNSQDVKAVAPGYVVFADWLRGYGLLTIVDHGEGYFSLYGHTQGLLSQPGQWVTAGETIALSNDATTQSSELSTDRFQGVYFEIRHNSQPLDPATWLVLK